MLTVNLSHASFIFSNLLYSGYIVGIYYINILSITELHVVTQKGDATGQQCQVLKEEISLFFQWKYFRENCFSIPFNFFLIFT